MSIELAYAAGIVDGEGCVTINTWRGRTRPIVKVAMIHEAPLKHLQTLFGGRIRLSAGRNDRKDHYIWTIQSKMARECLKQLLPFLLIKNKHAEIILNLKILSYGRGSQTLSPEMITERLLAVEQIRKLNIKGKAQ
jgi:hypothetical protein